MRRLVHSSCSRPARSHFSQSCSGPSWGGYRIMTHFIFFLTVITFGALGAPNMQPTAKSKYFKSLKTKRLPSYSSPYTPGTPSPPPQMDSLLEAAPEAVSGTERPTGVGAGAQRPPLSFTGPGTESPTMSFSIFGRTGGPTLGGQSSSSSSSSRPLPPAGNAEEVIDVDAYLPRGRDSQPDRPPRPTRKDLPLF